MLALAGKFMGRINVAVKVCKDSLKRNVAVVCAVVCAAVPAVTEAGLTASVCG